MTAVLFSLPTVANMVDAAPHRDHGQIAPPRDVRSPSQAAKFGSIRGRILAAETGTPLRKVQVHASSVVPGEPLVAISDVDGRYELREVPVGRYTMTAAKAGYVTLAYGQLRPYEAGRPIMVSDGAAETVNFVLPKGCIISGRVIDELGEPVPDTRVTPLRSTFFRGRRRVSPSGRAAITNDVGEFRIFGLEPGHYYLAAQPQSGPAPNDAFGERTSAFVSTYYPGSPNIADAQSLSVSLGGAATDVSIVLAEAPAARITGVVFGGDGRPLPGGSVAATLRGAAMTLPVGGRIQGDGSFVISNVPPGEYALVARAMRPTDDSPRAATVLNVNGQDVSGVQLFTADPVRITGHVIADRGELTQLSSSRIRIVSIPIPDDDDAAIASGSTAADTLAFEMKLHAGRHLIRLDNSASRQGWVLKAVRQNGTDVTDGGIDVRPDALLNNIDVEITRRASEVSGFVLTSDGSAVRECTVVMFAAQPEKWMFDDSRYIATARPDQEGRFSVRGLPPGQYFAVAINYVESGQAKDADFLSSIAERAVKFAVGETGTDGLRLYVAR